MTNPMRFVRLAVLFLLFANAAFAQSTTGSLDGVVRLRNSPAPGVTITISSPSLQGTRTAVTDAEGRFRFAGLPLGEYRIEAAMSGMSIVIARATVKIAQSSSLVLDMAVTATTGGPTDSNTGCCDGTEDEPPFTIVPVHYGTNRTRIASRATKFDYDSRVTDLSFGTARVSIPRDHRLGNWEKSLIAALARQDEHVMLLTVEPRGRSEFGTGLRIAVAKAKKREAFVFVHGYKTSFADAIQRTALLAYDLEFKGVPIAFVWPSRADFFRYTSDEDAAIASIEPLEQFLEVVARESKAERIHLIAHSMGNRVMIDALRSLQQRNAALPNLANLILTAPDVNIVRFGQLVPKIRKLPKRTTLYTSERDKALLMSRWLHDFARGGQGGRDIPVFEGVDSIDVSAIDRSLLSHSYHAENTSVIADLHALINDDKSPRDRRCLAPGRRLGLPFWVFQRACAP
jgi:esterase/lipase superfamily enzyme